MGTKWVMTNFLFPSLNYNKQSEIIKNIYIQPQLFVFRACRHLQAYWSLNILLPTIFILDIIVLLSLFKSNRFSSTAPPLAGNRYFLFLTVFASNIIEIWSATKQQAVCSIYLCIQKTKCLHLGWHKLLLCMFNSRF